MKQEYKELNKKRFTGFFVVLEIGALFMPLSYLHGKEIGPTILIGGFFTFALIHRFDLIRFLYFYSSSSRKFIICSLVLAVTLFLMSFLTLLNFKVGYYLIFVAGFWSLIVARWFWNEDMDEMYVREKQ